MVKYSPVGTVAIGGFGFPDGVTLDPSGNIHVVDSTADNVKVFNATGTLIETLN